VVPGLAQSEPEQPGVAVLPFRVHSAKPIDYLGESLANLVASRLEASGRVRVLDPAAVEDRLDQAALRETRDAALRAIAEELAADYVVTGSLTELAGRYSLDVRVTPAAIGLESQTLVLTAERDEIEGAGDLVDELLTRLESRVGEPYDAAAVRDDMAMLRGEPAIANASVETERGPEGVALHFQVVRAERLGATAGSRRPRFSRVSPPGRGAPSAPRRSPATCAR